jgi:uncharacterized membrane protein
MAYLVFYILKKLKIKIDKNLIFAVFPYIIFGSALRVLRDANILKGYLFTTPLIYFLVFGIAFSILLATNFIQKKKKYPYYKIMFSIGIIFLIPALIFINITNISAIKYILLFFVPWVLFLKIIPWKLENKLATATQMFDANVTFISLYFFGYYEQHVLPNYIINLFGHTYAFVIIKFVAVVSILYLIDRFSADKEINTYIKMIIAFLALATGTRDFLRLVFWV